VPPRGGEHIGYMPDVYMPDALGPTAAIALVFILAGFVKGVIGMGLPTVAMGFLTLLMPPAEAAAVLILPSFVTNVWQLAAGPQLMALPRRLWPMQVAAALATVAAAHWLGPVNSAAAVTGLGAALALYALLSLAPLSLGLPAVAEPWLGPIVGAATGIVTALTGVFVLPAVPYLQTLRLDPEDLVQALGLSFTVSTLALGVALAADGQFNAPHLGASLLGLLAAIAGMWLGQTLRTRMRPASFRLWFLLGLMGLGAHLMLRAIL
jgi:uncharacterized membrane protein YfcA